MVERPEAGAGVEAVDLSGRTALVTGSTGGVGRETALALGHLGAEVVVHGRDRAGGEAVVRELREAGAEAEFVAADFLVQDEVRGLADAVRDRVGTLDVVVNNAGAHFRRGELTGAGVERTMAVNHLAPFLLTNLLVPAMPADGRVVTVASRVHRRADLDRDLGALTSLDGYDGFEAYARSKLANVLFTRELARRVDIAANCLHPGFVPGSGLWRDTSLPIRAAVRILAWLPAAVRPFAATPAKGAETPVYLAAAPDLDATGEYFVDCEPAEPSPRARDDDLARRLWERSGELSGL